MVSSHGSTSHRFNGASWALLLLGVAGLMLCAAGLWTNVQSWRGDQSPYEFLVGLGVDSPTAYKLINVLPNLTSQFLLLGLAALIGLLFVNAVRWQRRHAR